MSARADPDRRYSAGARRFHWLTTLLVFTVIPLGWVFGGFKTQPKDPNSYVAPFPGTPADYASAHFSVGLIILALIALRIAFRLRNPPPRLHGHPRAAERALVHVAHGSLYAILIVMPVSGYVMTAGDKPPIVLFGILDLPKLPVGSALGYRAAVVHVYAQFALYGLIALHIAGVAWHLFVRRDDLLSRMLPPQRAPD